MIAWLYWIASRWLALCTLSLLACGLLMLWDWFFYRRLPHVRWCEEHREPHEFRLWRELVRIERLRRQFRKREP
ncbi:MAG: hypothetical protein IRY99_06675 [Isosphaeraceae bacterium]|nr:hypothetical protein [Isosphaeraceae bacterium]